MHTVGLRALSIFDVLDDDQLQVIASIADLVDVPAGQVVFSQGSRADRVYVVLSGRIILERAGQEVDTRGSGDVLGEMAMFNRYRRVATARAAEDSQLLALRERVVQPLALRQDSAVVELLQHLGALAVERLQTHEQVEIAELDEHPGQQHAADDPATDYWHHKQELVSGWALAYHSIGRSGKLGITTTKPAATAADLSVAYSPGVAQPCLVIAQRPEAAYDYTGKGHLIAVITNGTAVLGLGPIGALAAKPVMEGKAVLFKRFADVDAFDIEIDEQDPDAFIEHVVAISPTFGGINLEDIAAPHCFHIERELRRRLDIPVMHDDQHGTAIVIGAALLNALELTGRPLEDVRVVFSGAGAAGVASARHLITLGLQPDNLVMTDIDGVVHSERGDTGDLAALAATTDARTLAEAIEGADVFVGVSAPNVLTPEMLRSMAPDPVVFALANPVPEIDPGVARATRADAIVATGRSDHANQVNNVLAFPYVFRGALDVRATAITEGMKAAATRAIAELARRPITSDAGFEPEGLAFGRGYLIPKPFDLRLLPEVATAVAAAALYEGVATTSLHLDAYRHELSRMTGRR